MDPIPLRSCIVLPTTIIVIIIMTTMMRRMNGVEPVMPMPCIPTGVKETKSVPIVESSPKVIFEILDPNGRILMMPKI
jgi:hypothetical protein